MTSTTHYINLLSNPSLSLIESFATSVNREAHLSKDDKGRWDVDRIIKYKFSECLYTTIDGNIVNMTFNKWYDKFLRVGINSYTLLPFRSKVFRPLWKKGGYMDLTHEKHSAEATGYFCSYYAKNNKIRSVVKMLSKEYSSRNFSFGGQPTGWLDKFTIYNKEPINFRYVQQYISYANNHGSAEKNYAHLIQVIQNDKF